MWDQVVLTKLAVLHDFKLHIDRRDQQWLVQFLMALQDDFEEFLRQSYTVILFQVLIKWLMSIPEDKMRDICTDDTDFHWTRCSSRDSFNRN